MDTSGTIPAVLVTLSLRSELLLLAWLLQAAANHTHGQSFVCENFDIDLGTMTWLTS